MRISTLLPQTLQRMMQIEQILSILTTRALALQDVSGQLVGILGAEKLRVGRQANVDKAADWGTLRWRRGVERRELYRVAVYLANVHELAHCGDFVAGDVVGGAPDALGGVVLFGGFCLGLTLFGVGWDEMG